MNLNLPPSLVHINVIGTRCVRYRSIPSNVYKTVVKTHVYDCQRSRLQWTNFYCEYFCIINTSERKSDILLSKLLLLELLVDNWWFPVLLSLNQYCILGGTGAMKQTKYWSTGLEDKRHGHVRLHTSVCLQKVMDEIRWPPIEKII